MAHRLTKLDSRYSSKRLGYERCRDFEALGGRAVRTGHSAMSHLGTWVAWKHARQQIDPASMIVDPHKTRGCVAMPAEAAKVSCSNQNFVSQRQAFYKSGGLSLVPVRPWSRSGAIFVLYPQYIKCILITGVGRGPSLKGMLTK